MALACSNSHSCSLTLVARYPLKPSRPQLVTPPIREASRFVARAASVAAPEADAVAVVRECAEKPGAHPASELLSAMLALEKKKLPTTGWTEILSAPQARWKLVFTSDSKQVAAANKKQPNKGGIYFPIPACQKFDGGKMSFENGVFFGPIAFLTFEGPYTMQGKQLWFDVVNMRIGLGPWSWTIPLKKNAKLASEMTDQERKALPFFLYAYVDEAVVVARGRGGGVALWQRTDKEWEAKSGVLNAYK